MHHRLAVLKQQAALAQTDSLREQYRVNIQQIEAMMEKEPVPVDVRSAEHELAAQILALDEGEEGK